MSIRTLWAVVVGLSTLAPSPARAIFPAPVDTGIEASDRQPLPAAEPLTPQKLWYRVGVELAKRDIQLAELGLRMEFAREEHGEWLVEIVDRSTGCTASRSIGAFEHVSPARARTIAFAVVELIRRSGCLGSTAPALPAERTADWVKPAAAIWATASAVSAIAVAQSEPPNLSLSLAHAPSAYFSAALGVGLAGGTATLLVAETAARPTLELSLFASGALMAGAFAAAGEPGVPSYGAIALASGYGATALLVGLDWTLSEPAAMLSISPREQPGDRPQRALSPWLRYGPAVAGSLASMAPAFSPAMDAKDRELVVGFGAGALVPALGALILGVADSERGEPGERRLGIASGPAGSIGIGIGGHP